MLVLYFLKLGFAIFILSVNILHASLFVQRSEGQKSLDFPGPGVTDVRNCHVGARNQAQVLCKSKECI